MTNKKHRKSSLNQPMPAYSCWIPYLCVFSCIQQKTYCKKSWAISNVHVAEGGCQGSCQEGCGMAEPQRVDIHHSQIHPPEHPYVHANCLQGFSFLRPLKFQPILWLDCEVHEGNLGLQGCMHWLWRFISRRGRSGGRNNRR